MSLFLFFNGGEPTPSALSGGVTAVCTIGGTLAGAPPIVPGLSLGGGAVATSSAGGTVASYQPGPAAQPSTGLLSGGASAGSAAGGKLSAGNVAGLSAGGAASSSAGGTLTAGTVAALSAGGAASSSAGGALSVGAAAALSGGVSASSSAGGALSAGAAVVLSGGASARSSAGGSLSTGASVALSGGAEGASSAGGSLSAGLALSGGASAWSSAGGTLGALDGQREFPFPLGVAGIPPVVDVAAGFDAVLPFTVVDETSHAVALFGAADTLSAVAWPGDGEPAGVALQASWVDPPTARAIFTVPAASTASMGPGAVRFRIAVRTSPEGRSFALFDGTIRVQATAAAAPALPQYCTLQDMVDAGGGAWLEALDDGSGPAAFAQQRSRARKWLDELIVRKFRPFANRGACYELGITGPAAARNVTLLQYLTADYDPAAAATLVVQPQPGQTCLIVTDKIREVVALKAVELVCRGRVGVDSDDVWSKRESRFRNLCNNLVVSASAEIDTDFDGQADYAFPLGLISIR